MDKKKIERINFLARKSKTVGLTELELLEQAKLRQEYRDAFKASLEVQLNNISIVEEDGSVTDLSKKN
ncbi:MAG: DUF896 domain-containing protein [Oscillospiraceae bacterium]|nr:DUF896 domain-containing protein [Oscillospiraceae bacterium]